MSNQNNNDTVPLRDYVDAKVEAIEKATDLARESMERRLEGMNEFRSALKDQTSKFITRVEHESLQEKVGSISKQMDKRPTWLMTFIFLIMSFLLGLLSTILLQ